jgi:nucleoside-diphosphate-sugar epimerase
LPDGGAALVTGAAGFFGLAIVKSLSAAGVPVVATDRVEPGEFVVRPGTDVSLVRYLRCDVSTEPLDDLVADAAGVVHAAALTPDDERRGDTAEQLLAVNLGALFALLAAMRRSGSCSRLLFVSSAGVYDQSNARTIAESDASGGTSLYGSAKLAAELVARRYASLFELELCAVRPTSLFGGGELVRPSRPRVTGFARLVAAAARGEPVRIERPDSRADWLCVDDAADAVALLWRSDRLDGSSFNLSSGRPRAFREVAEAVVEAAGLRLDDAATALVDGGPDRPAVLPNERLRAAIGWEPRRTFADGAADLLEDPRFRAWAQELTLNDAPTTVNS